MFFIFFILLYPIFKDELSQIQIQTYLNVWYIIPCYTMLSLILRSMEFDSLRNRVHEDAKHPCVVVICTTYLSEGLYGPFQAPALFTRLSSSGVWQG